MASNHDVEERRSKMVLRRRQRFIGNAGLCERFERRGDNLLQFNDIVNWLTAGVGPGLARDAIIRRFVFSAQNGGFGWRRYGSRRAVADLIDLDRVDTAAGQYPLGPSAFTVEMRPEDMRAPRTVWVKWLQTQGLPVPVELASRW